ncbi:hypothetical protein EV363DRAFT_1257650 [Boletus edulis]|nr:hypothetical protein EV363DRAFT_1257647 [Boletus edulis]KAF8134486.1 hypothetical protein EV363DRAFT_1257650 [Boletus edulis]
MALDWQHYTILDTTGHYCNQEKVRADGPFASTNKREKFRRHEHYTKFKKKKTAQTDGPSTKETETNTRNHVTFVHDLRFTTRVPLERTGRPCNCLTPTPTPKEGQGIERRSPKIGPELYLDLGFEPILNPHPTRAHDKQSIAALPDPNYHHGCPILPELPSTLSNSMP